MFLIAYIRINYSTFIIAIKEITHLDNSADHLYLIVLKESCFIVQLN